MPLSLILNQWKKDPGIGPNFSAWITVPKRDPQWSPFPSNLDPRISSFLEAGGIDKLYQHQKFSWDKISTGCNIILSTGTASGKSLAYQLPVLNEIFKNKESTALLLFPTKALARDQLAWFDQFSEITAKPYDGDTPHNQRKLIRENAQIIISNPDMLHLGILPYHTSWAKFFSELKYVVLDEIHIYRGVFGSHVANLLRRLKRITNHYGSYPQYILSSATIGNPYELGHALLETDLSLIDEDTSARGEKHFLVYNPPIIDPKLGYRASLQGEMIRLAADLIEAGLQTIIFGRSRRSVEFMLSRLKERLTLPDNSLQSYRSGYLAEQRRKLESGLRSGEIKCITATTALELGVDIGGLDASLLAGYPGTIAGTWQQAGRSGRGERPSLSVLALSSTPLDQYIALHPDYLLLSNPERALINPDNLLIVLDHIKCAAYELPFGHNEPYGAYDISQTSEILSVLEQQNYLHKSENGHYWMSDAYPSADVSLRATSHQQIALRKTDDAGQVSLLGEVDYESAFWMVHPGAIYLHQGEFYYVEELDLDSLKASLIPTTGEYYTEAVKLVDFELLEPHGEDNIPGGIKHFGEIQVTSQVDAYKRINWERYELLGVEPLDLPPIQLNSMGFWLSLSEDTELQLRNIRAWNSSPNDYGPNWKTIRQSVLQRDKFTCISCSQHQPSSSLHVHHIEPLRSYSSFQEANQLSNLISLCPTCHRRAESVVRVKSGISGLGYLLHNLAPLILMCDPGDLSYHTDFAFPLSHGRPAILLYEHIPAGIGFSRYLYENISDLLEMAKNVVHACPCEDGCPGCVGPGGELGSGGKIETREILGILYP
jgi:DEAD/DEAH box helicase domain-containing protein